MDHRNRLPFAESQSKGFRLHKVELWNWGTFDGHVFTVRPEGQSALLIGQNGSGKSTLVDAILTLLVRPGLRNFNVAAGARKRERDERSYLLRTVLPHTKSLLMNEDVLLEWRSSIGTTSNGRTGAELPNLTPQESQAFQVCSVDNLRIEQERIPQGFVLKQLTELVGIAE